MTIRVLVTQMMMIWPPVTLRLSSNLSYRSLSTPPFSNILSEPISTESHQLPTSRDIYWISPINATQSCLVRWFRSKANFGYKLVGDNVDKRVKARYTRYNKKYSRDMHYHHYYALRDRIDISGISDTIQDCLFHSSDVLPTTQFHDTNSRISRVIVDNQKYFTCYSDAVTSHIQHDFYEQMSSKSDIVSDLTSWY